MNVLAMPPLGPGQRHGVGGGGGGDADGAGEQVFFLPPGTTLWPAAHRIGTSVTVWWWRRRDRQADALFR